MGEVRQDGCPVCDGQPRVLLAMSHPAMLRMTHELLEREFACWIATEAHSGDELVQALDAYAPDLMVIDASDFPRGCASALDHIRVDHVIVIGPEPDASYRAAAIAGGAGAWLPRDRVGEELALEMRRVLGCTHAPCPPGHRHQRTPAAARQFR